jgi:hypothetical protein
MAIQLRNRKRMARRGSKDEAHPRFVLPSAKGMMPVLERPASPSALHDVMSRNDIILRE